MRSILITIFMGFNLYAAFETTNFTGFSNGMIQSPVSDYRLFSAYLRNPAASGFQEVSVAGLSYFRPFAIPELNAASIVLAMPYKAFGFGAALQSFGNRLYRESRLSVNASRHRENERYSIGLNMHWYSLYISNYGNSHTFGLDAGVLYKLTDNISAGFSVQNINRPAVNGHEEEIPVISNWGLGLDLYSGLSGYLSVSKETHLPVNLQFALKYRTGTLFSVYSGYQTYPSIPSAGITFTTSIISLYYSFQYHFNLGSTHSWGISLQKPGK